MHRPSSEASNPEQRIWEPSAYPRSERIHANPLYVSGSIDKRLRCVALEQVDWRTCEEGGRASGLGETRRTYRSGEDDSSPGLGAAVVVE